MLDETPQSGTNWRGVAMMITALTGAVGFMYNTWADSNKAEDQALLNRSLYETLGGRVELMREQLERCEHAQAHLTERIDKLVDRGLARPSPKPVASRRARRSGGSGSDAGMGFGSGSGLAAGASRPVLVDPLMTLEAAEVAPILAMRVLPSYDDIEQHVQQKATAYEDAPYGEP